MVTIFEIERAINVLSSVAVNDSETAEDIQSGIVVLNKILDSRKIDLVNIAWERLTIEPETDLERAVNKAEYDHDNTEGV